MPAFKLVITAQTKTKRDTMAQVKIQQRKQGAGKFQVRQPKTKNPIPRFAA